MLKSAVAFLCTSLCALTLCNAEQDQNAMSTKALKEDCGQAPRPMRVEMRHIEPNGIGYNQGYTTLEGFFAPLEPIQGAWLPFLDLRGHLFNDGEPAANTGLGLRYLDSSRIWGINSYYDYRKTHHQHYNQVSLGFETLGKIWDARVNGYLPVGKNTSASYDTKFSHFHENYAYISQKQEFAMKGANAEVGYHVNHFRNAPLYFTAGPYYLEGKGRVAWGGQLRAAIDIFDYVRIEGNTSYDNVFKWIGQGQLSVAIPFGRKQTVKLNKRSCSDALTLSARALQKIYRSEIIPVHKRKQTFSAINPTTGLPWVFWFVDNTSHSSGTYESPYPTLLAAQEASSENQAIYVFPGDDTNNGMNQGFSMQANQKLWGSGIDNFLPTQLGLITIPAQTTTLPLITNTTIGAQAIVTMSDNCEVSGLNCSSISTSLNYGIQGGDAINNTFTVANPSLRGNIVDTPNALGAAIGLSPTGVATLVDCLATGSVDSAILITTGNSIETLTAILSNCTAIAAEATSTCGICLESDQNLIATLTDCEGQGNFGILLYIANEGNLTTTLTNCQGYGTTGSGTAGIQAYSTQGNIYATLTNCTGQGPLGGGDGIFLNSNQGSIYATLTNCQGQGEGGRPGIDLVTNNDGDIIATLINCQGQGAEAGGPGILLETSTVGNLTATLTSCTGEGSDNNYGIGLVAAQNLTASLTNCTGIGPDSDGIHLEAPLGNLTVTLSGNPALLGTGANGVTYISPNTTVIAN